mmetsp:Transcript_27329/g.43806  ORF Transcript_27329/g.43806 Transcript_27329/m.43806 type:complete len:281 (+) Transcript_27329:289-1131(+)
MLGQQVDIVLVCLGLLPVLQQVQLGQDLVCEGAGHHEGWVACGAAQVHKAAGGKHNDTVAFGEHKPVHLWLDVLNRHARELLKVLHVNLVVEVADVANDGVVLHLLHVLKGDDLEVACGRSEDVDLVHAVLHGHHLEALHARLQGVDGVDLGDKDAGTGTPESEGAALAHVAVAAHQGTLAADHHVGGAHDAVWQGVAAAVDVVELGLSHAVVHVDGREEQLTFDSHRPQAEDAGSGLLADALAPESHARVLGLVQRNGVLQKLQNALELGVRGAGRVRQ